MTDTATMDQIPTKRQRGRPRLYLTEEDKLNVKRSNDRKYYNQNTELKLEKVRQYYIENRDSICERKRLYYIKKKKKIEIVDLNNIHIFLTTTINLFLY